MNPEDIDKDGIDPDPKKKAARAALSVFGAAIPIIGGLLSAASGYWSEKDQEHAMNILKQWVQMLEDELREKAKTISEILSKIDMQDDNVRDRIESEEYQSLLKKAFRNWASVDTELKRQRIRNILSNAASSSLSSDDVVKLFIDWVNTYSDFHFQVVGEIYRNPGTTRGKIWENTKGKRVREDSADADLFKLLVRDLSTGGVIRQHRKTDYAGNFMAKQNSRPSTTGGGRKLTSAFDNSEPYELTELGKQFVHYAMTEIPTKISFFEE